MSRAAVSVSDLVRYVRSKLETDARLSSVIVEGEISNFVPYRSGHWYFSLKDASSQIRCVMFASNNNRVQFTPRDGDKVLVQGNLSIYEGRGEMQLVVTGMKTAGIGDLYLQFERLKQKLEYEGLFAVEHKKPIPKYPMNIALVTGKNTAARADVLNTLGRRWPVAKISEAPVLVQGKESAKQITDALKKIDTMGFDVILLVRGGGSIEDLWSFNDETLARTIYDLITPIITGVGHEVDTTIVDYVSDLRAPTPTGAAERCSPDIKDVQETIRQYENRMTLRMTNRLNTQMQRLDGLVQRPVLKDPDDLYKNRKILLDSKINRLHACMQRVTKVQSVRITKAKLELIRSSQGIAANNRIAIQKKKQLLEQDMQVRLVHEKNRLASNAGLLDALSPLKIMSRGYSIASREGHVVHSVRELQVKDEVQIRLSDGTVRAEVCSVEEKEYGKD